ncbi:phosphatidylethanolamine-binding protein 4 isoform X1 [Vanacampus margaritifer]
MTVLPVFLLLCGSMWGTRHGGVTAGTLSSEDASFCRDGLEVLYPELHVDGCLIVPKDDRNLRKKLTTEWEAPTIRYPEADENTFYTLVMVDPDAPSRSSPSQRYWRHWLVTDVKGSSLLDGPIQGKTITRYVAPTPPPGSGFHRYQFLLYMQTTDMPALAMPPRGGWHLEAFVTRLILGEPVARVQFLTQHSED